MKKRNFCVVTCDIKRSRKLQARALVQKKVFAAINTLNRKYQNELLAPFRMTMGDEFQGVLRSGRRSYQVSKDVHHTLDVYCGIGVGIITTKLTTNPSEMDGPAFHRSRVALEEAKKGKLDAVIKTPDENRNALLNALIWLVLHIRRNWTKRQSEVVDYLDSHPSRQNEVAKHFKMSPQAVSKVVKKTGWREVSVAERILNKLLEEPARLQSKHVYSNQLSMS
jgi:hypothetical protein